MKLSAILAPLIEAKADHETIMRVVKAFEDQQTDALERRRANDRERQERRRHVKSREVTVNASSHAGVARGLDNLPTKKITGQEERKEESALTREFSDFWSVFPNKVGKRDAEKAFANARRRADLPAILAGVERYAAKTDDRPWCNPATFLNQDRWADQPAAAPQQRGGAPPFRPRPMNAVESNLQRRIRRNESVSGGQDHGNVELFPPDKPELRRLAFDAGAAVRWPVGSSDH